jgi:hypothetical protein
VGLRDALFGKQKLAGPARERLFALTTAAVTLDTELGLRPAGEGGERDNAVELELKARREKELPLVPDLARALILI